MTTPMTAHTPEAGRGFLGLRIESKRHPRRGDIFRAVTFTSAGIKDVFPWRDDEGEALADGRKAQAGR